MTVFTGQVKAVSRVGIDENINNTKNGNTMNSGK